MDREQLSDIEQNLMLLRKDLALHVQPELTSINARSRLTIIVDLVDMLRAEIAADAAPHGSNDMAALAEEIADKPFNTISIDLRQRIATAAGADELRLTGRNRSGHDSYVESGAGAQATAAADARSFDTAALQHHLRSRWPAYADIVVTNLRMLPGGFSKSTYLVNVEQHGVSAEWVLRRDLPFSPLQSAVPEEFPLLQALYARGLPVAEPLWCEADPGPLGAATLAVRRIAGESDMTRWSADPKRAAAICHAAARIIAAIHAIDPAGLPRLETDAPGARGATPDEQLDHLRAFWDEKRIAPNPLVELVFKWLYANIPGSSVQVLVHGDFGLHNVIVEGTGIAALLDWEFAHFGDPREDLAYGRPFVAKIMPWTDFVSSYVAAGGTAPDDAALDYYSVFGTFRNALGCFNVLHAVRNKLGTIDAKFGYVGRAYANALLQDAARLAGAI